MCNDEALVNGIMNTILLMFYALVMAYLLAIPLAIVQGSINTTEAGYFFLVGLFVSFPAVLNLELNI